MTVSPVSPIRACTGQHVDVQLEVRGGERPYHWFSEPEIPDLVLEQNSTERAALRGTLEEPGLFKLAVGVQTATSCAPFEVQIDVAETPRITSSLPDACVGEPVDFMLAAEGGDSGSYTWVVEGVPELEQQGARLFGSAPAAAGEYALQVSLRDDRCPVAGAPLVTKTLPWTVRAPGECPRVATTALPAPCEGIFYSEKLIARDGSGEGYAWTVLSEALPDGLAFNPADGTVSGTPTGQSLEGALVVLLTDSEQQRAVASLDVALRQDCWLAFVAEEPARVFLRDVFGAEGIVALPRTLAADEAVRDMKFSPDGAWLAVRAGPLDSERLHIYPTLVPHAADATAVSFVCPNAAAACAVIDYAWSSNSRDLAVVLSGPSPTQDYLSGLDVTAPSAPWPVVDGASRDEVIIELDYQRDLVWAPGGRFGFVGPSGDPTSEQMLYWAPAGLAAQPRAEPIFVNDGRLRATQKGWAAFDAFYYTLTTFTPPVSFANHELGWTSPSGLYAARTLAGSRLAIFDIDAALEPLATSDPGLCGVVVAWSPAAGGWEKILCSDGSLGAPGGNDLTVFDYQAGSDHFEPPQGREIPTNGTYVPAPLANTRRIFSPSADWLLVGSPAQSVTLTQITSGTSALPQPRYEIPMAPPVEVQFSPDGRSLLIYDQNGLRRLPVPDTGRGGSSMEDAAGVAVPSPNLFTCEEAIWVSPDGWCGSPRARGHIAISADSNSALFEGAGDGLWLVDLHAVPQRPAIRLTSSLAPCSTPCRDAAYAFQP